MALSIEPLTPVFGAKVTGFSIRDGVDDATFAEIEAAFEEYSVLYFPDQPVDDDVQIAFCERFGALEETFTGVVGANTKTQRISNAMPDGTIKEPDGHLARFARANQFWHTDSSFRAVPAKASLLSARILPQEGGDTEFASTRVAYDRLSADEQAQLEQMIAVHSITHSRRTLGDNAVSEEQKRALPPVRQALVRTNPVNGRKSLLIGAHVCSIEGMRDDEAQALNDRLVDSAIAAGTYRHHWKPGDMVLWDNRAVLHRGHAYDEVNEVRTLIRTTVAGAGPTVVDGRIVSGR